MELQIEYRHNLLEHELILKEKDISSSSYKICMLERNNIPGLLNVKVVLVDEFVEFKYRISNKSSLVNQVNERKIQYHGLEAIRKSLVNITEYLEEYLLDVEDLMLKPEYIFLEPETWEVCYCYLPGWKCDAIKEIRSLMEYLVKEMDHIDDKVIKLGYEMYDLSVKPNFKLQDLSTIDMCEHLQQKELVEKGLHNKKEQSDEENKNNSKRNIKSIVIISVISIIILVVGIAFYLIYMGYQLF